MPEPCFSRVLWLFQGFFVALKGGLEFFFLGGVQEIENFVSGSGFTPNMDLGVVYPECTYAGRLLGIVKHIFSVWDG